MTDFRPEAEELAQILSALPEIALVVDRERKIRFINRFEEGYGPEDVLGADALQFVAQEARDAQRQLLDRVFSTGAPTEQVTEIVDAEGERQWHRARFFPLTDDDDQVISVVVMTRNVTAEQEARREAEQLRKLLPMCSWCGRIRTEEGEWMDLETYLEGEGKGRVTHGMCPVCEARVTSSAESSA